MNKKLCYLMILCFSFSLIHLGMSRNAVYDEEARQAQKLEKKASEKGYTPARTMASGVKNAAIDSPKELLSETADATKSRPPVVGTLEGARVGGSKAVESAAKGVFKVATLGYADTDTMRVEQPEAESGEVTKFKINL